MTPRTSASKTPASKTPAPKERRFGWHDILAGFSVSLIAIPQSLAYAELAGMPAYTGLYAVALPALLAAFFASSPYLQCGPVATTSLLTFGVLSQVAEPFSADYVAFAALLALMIGVLRVLIGVLRLGRIAYLMSQPILMGFTSAAALLILASQLPTALGVQAQGEDIFARLWFTLTNVTLWEPAALLLSALTVALITLGKRLHPLFPSVLVAVLVGLGYSLFVGYSGPVIGAIPVGLPPFSLRLPWAALPQLLVGALVIAVVGFAEAASISRTYATQDRQSWNANREFVSQGVANLAAGVSGGFPVGASFSRSSVNRLAGAKTRWSGAVTGVLVLAFLPFTWILSNLPNAILGAIVIAAIFSLLKLGPLLAIRHLSTPQTVIAWTTFTLTLVLAPRIDVGLLVGITLALVIHLWREQTLSFNNGLENDVLVFRPMGVLWFGSVSDVTDVFNDLLLNHPEAEKLEFDLGGLGRIDLSAALLIKRLMEDARDAGLNVSLTHISPNAERWLGKLWQDKV